VHNGGYFGCCCIGSKVNGTVLQMCQILLERKKKCARYLVHFYTWISLTAFAYNQEAKKDGFV